MKIAIAQINFTVGDLAGNVARIVEFAERARDGGARLMVTPELAVCGYPPEDLLLRDDFIAACERSLADLATRVRGITLVVGHPRAVDGKRYNSASVIQDGAVVAVYDKHNLPNYTVFDEERYFEPGAAPCVFGTDGVRFGVNICEDTWGAGGPGSALPRLAGNVQLGVNICADSWQAEAPRAARAAGAAVLLVLNASPYHLNKQQVRYDIMRERVAETGMPLIYVNLVGGQDELVFDGASFVLDAQGAITHQLPAFEEALGFVELVDGVPAKGGIAPSLSLEGEVYAALTLGVRDYLDKNGFPGALLGLSGGVDSALTLAIAADALGPERVRAVMMPSQYTAGMSREDALAEAQSLNVRYTEIAIKPIFDAFKTALTGEFKGLPEDTTEENLQARIRGTLLMALSNKSGAIVLTTGNKSEMGVGYATLYGDMAGGFAVLKDINKMMVYRLARYRNSISPVIPQRVIDRAPSAELRPDQTDQDSLPPYDVLDAIMEAYVEADLSPLEIIARGHARADVEKVVRLVHVSEYKRRQAPVGIRITSRGFGKDWRYPITNKFRQRFE
ncbi:MAG: NAD+ synthase [Betaproteobacteria bacterium RIFCSPLOWO2_02_64_14]|nr:MAG: NAD+ synthase [Betaproteobacteria bacterium RIFCSPLOWO2_02_64_14]